jgi:hypothetical protein
VALVLAAASPDHAPAQGIPRLSPSPTDQVIERASRPAPAAPAPAPPAERYVPERRVRVNEGGRETEVVVPGHWERRITDQQVLTPPRPGFGPQGIIHLPGGERPPAAERQAP